ncbi:MAG: Fic family protein [Clostridia bacterium]|nr:Fic family protein [Clostridia bacterium]MBQ8620613.1 Fic family protein [Clostridia bacterium]
MPYEPPFTISNRMLTLVAEIAEKTGRISNYRTFESKPHLRRNNRIRSIHSSLAIEANSLSLDEVKGVIAGKTVLGPQKEIQEVKNAYQAYDQIGEFDPYSVDDLKSLHGVMTYLTVQESGMFRTGDEGVFRDNKCIFMAPPPHLVPEQMESLFGWMRRAADTVHPLILSSVFHYEFVFIHPFADGNGRMARLWQTALLSAWNPVFQYLPLESRIHEFQDEYYEAIAACHRVGKSDEFVEFMLDKINLTLDWVLTQVSGEDAYLTEQIRRLLDVMEYDVPYTAAQIMAALGLKSKENLRKLYIGPAMEKGLVVMGMPDKPTSRNQTYIRVG